MHPYKKQTNKQTNKNKRKNKQTKKKLFKKFHKTTTQQQIKAASVSHKYLSIWKSRISLQLP